MHCLTGFPVVFWVFFYVHCVYDVICVVCVNERRCAYEMKPKIVVMTLFFLLLSCSTIRWPDPYLLSGESESEDPAKGKRETSWGSSERDRRSVFPDLPLLLRKKEMINEHDMPICLHAVSLLSHPNTDILLLVTSASAAAGKTTTPSPETRVLPDNRNTRCRRRPAGYWLFVADAAFIVIAKHQSEQPTGCVSVPLCVNK